MAEESSSHPPGNDRIGDSTPDLLLRVRSGDGVAATRLYQRYQPTLRRLAHGRLPPTMRDLLDTDDLVQETLVIAFKRLEDFEYRREGAFLAYLRQILFNQLRQEIRRHSTRPGNAPLVDVHPAPGESPEDVVSWLETFDRYEQALQTLGEQQREAVIMRVEFGFEYQEIAGALGKSSANAARMSVVRGVTRVARIMGARHAGEKD